VNKIVFRTKEIYQNKELILNMSLTLIIIGHGCVNLEKIEMEVIKHIQAVFKVYAY